MVENELQKLIGKQFLITSYIESKLQIVNYIKEGYDSNRLVLINNSFLHFTAHTYYRSIIIDLHALFGTPNKNKKQSFKQVSNDHIELLNPGTVETVLGWINSAKEDIKAIEELRHQQIAHYDFTKKDAISLNFNNINRLNNLYELAKKIIIFYGRSFKDQERIIEYMFESKSDYLESLQRLISKTNNI